MANLFLQCRWIIGFNSKEAAAANNQFENLIPNPTVFTELDQGALPFTSLSCCLTCTATAWRHGERLLSMQVQRRGIASKCMPRNSIAIK
jgi:hypothetical protein